MATLTTTAEELRIRPAAWDDMETIANFVRSTADWYRPFVSDEDMAEHEVPDAWKAENYARRDFYVGSVEGTPVGTISLQYFGDFAYVGYVYLSANQVGRGYGQELLEFATGLASRKGMRGVALIAHPEATWATRAYTKFGFELVAEEREDVLAWNDGVLRDYYEEGFQLFVYWLVPESRR
ncbi:MAG: GNAT family N-acetyltransferase [Planctomycetes bacterium]|nr:GNAT family N-acetyltransferase [Planctomycetota bacterium]